VRERGWEWCVAYTSGVRAAVCTVAMEGCRWKLLTQTTGIWEPTPVGWTTTLHPSNNPRILNSNNFLQLWKKRSTEYWRNMERYGVKGRIIIITTIIMIKIEVFVCMCRIPSHRDSHLPFFHQKPIERDNVKGMFRKGTLPHSFLRRRLKISA
jgi:hypothetical protein